MLLTTFASSVSIESSVLRVGTTKTALAGGWVPEEALWKKLV